MGLIQSQPERCWTERYSVILWEDPAHLLVR
jgi:hypothetical protein